MSRPANDKSMTTTPAAGAETPEKMGGVFRLDTAAASVADPAQIQFASPVAKRVSTQMVALVLVLVLGGGLLWGMRKLGIGPLNHFAGASMPDYDMSQLGTNKTADHKRILDELTANYSKTQVPLDQVQRNPFRLADGLSKPEVKPGEDPAKVTAEQQKRIALQRKDKVKAALANLKLNGVLGGSTPVARISGDAVRIGETVGDYFTVKAIHGRSVELTCENEVYTLTMDDDQKNTTKHGKK